MDIKTALKAFDALSQESRLKAFRILVEHGKQGIAAGALSKRLRIPHNTLSFHLSHLASAELVTAKKQGRSVIYFANLDRMQGLVGFLVENCCAVDKASCKGIKKLMEACAC